MKKIRLNRIRCLLISPKDAILITSKTNRRYFTEFCSSDGFLLLTQNSSIFMTDSRYIEAARQSLSRELEVVEINEGYKSVSEMLKKLDIRNVYLEAEHISVSRVNKLTALFKNVGATIDTTGTLDLSINNLRIAKSADEIKKIEHAQKITEKSFEEVLNFVKPGVEERKIALELEYIMRKNGADTIAFDLITLTGENTANPHGTPGKTLIMKGDLFQFDIGAVCDGYCCDMSRVVSVGKPTEEQKKIYDVVLNAQKAAIAAAQPGAYACDVDSAARKIIDEAGYGEYFRHATGHGVGLNIHEAPNVSAKSKVFLSPGMIITVEPGIYLPGKFGVRIEDMLLITKSSNYNITSAHKELIII